MIVNEEEFKKKILVGKFIEEFGRDVVLNQTIHFIPSIEDLEKMFSIVNELVFSNKLVKMPKFQFKTVSKTAKGDFGCQIIGKNSLESITIEELKDESKVIYVIGIRKDPEDSFLNIASTLCHEMIHYYDTLYGPLKEFQYIPRTMNNGRQMAGKYDVHSEFFKKYENICYELGIYVEETYKKKGTTYLMIDDNGVFINSKGIAYEAEKTNNGVEKILGSDPEIVKYAKNLFNSLKSDGYIGISVKDNVFSFVID